MRIAQVAPLHESVPPKYYGGTERVVSYLTEELVSQGHDVTLFASGDSVTSARLVSDVARSLRLDPNVVDDLAPHFVMLERLRKRVHEFDVVHFHCDYLHFPWSRRMSVPHLTTLHGRLDFPHLAPLYEEYSEVPVVAISRSQRRGLPQANFCGTVHHGLPLDVCAPRFEEGEYFAFLGRISPEKGVDRAIEIAKRMGVPLKLAAKIGKQDEPYYHDVIAPMLKDPLIDFVGEIGEQEKAEFLGRARALLFTIEWPEPFGLAMIESLACGTPVIAYDRGSVPEIIDQGVTGFVVRSIDEAVAAAQRVHTLDRRLCRAMFERRFSVQRMAEDYLELYSQLLAARLGTAAAATHFADWGPHERRQLAGRGPLPDCRALLADGARAQARRDVRRLRSSGRHQTRGSARSGGLVSRGCALRVEAARASGA
jgi:glycosyltransferase involved in cell wall biosynthesis